MCYYRNRPHFGSDYGAELSTFPWPTLSNEKIDFGLALGILVDEVRYRALSEASVILPGFGPWFRSLDLVPGFYFWSQALKLLFRNRGRSGFHRLLIKKVGAFFGTILSFCRIDITMLRAELSIVRAQFRLQSQGNIKEGLSFLYHFLLHRLHITVYLVDIIIDDNLPALF